MATCLSIDFKAWATRLQRLVGVKPKPQKRTLTISAPFNFKHETGASLPGVSDDEIAILKEKAAASCIGVADGMVLRSPRRAPRPPSMRPMAQVTSPGFPRPSQGNMI